MFYFAFMDNQEHPVIGFGLDYGGELIYCEAVMKDNHYEVLFNGNWFASIVHTDELNWLQESGTILPAAIVEEIGLKIESNYL